jgi:type II secretory ATPase GspE/PulE/Tfp pilus assembly ATPase PilB-like protein
MKKTTQTDDRGHSQVHSGLSGLGYTDQQIAAIDDLLHAAQGITVHVGPVNEGKGLPFDCNVSWHDIRKARRSAL